MADVYEKDLAQKTSLTTSDYIRVVGSDNVSYKQSVSAVADAVGSYNATPTLLTDCNDATDPSKIYYANGSTANRPSNAWFFIKCEACSGNMLFQTAYHMNATDVTVYQRSRNTNGTWGSWDKQPTRAEVDKLKTAVGDVSFTVTTTSANVEKSITIPNGYRGVMWTIDSATNKCGMSIVYSTSTGSVTLVSVLTASGLTISSSTNTISITSSGITHIVFMNVAGKATV